jgi:hypothetical protein
LYGLLAHNGYQASYPDELDDVKPPDFDEINQVQLSTKVDIDLHMDMKSEKRGETNRKVDEDIDIDLDDPDTEAAAIKIQASIRGRQARKQVREIKETKEEIEETVEEFDIDLTDPETSLAATKIQAGYRGSKARKEVVSLRQERIDIDDEEVNKHVVEEEIDIDMDDPETAKAATKIQASFRGSQSRKEVKSMKEKVEETVTAQEVEEEIDIDMDDPETAKAATKIQASFRGSQSRKEVKSMKEKEEIIEENVTAQEAEEEIDIDMDDPETALAATKIQASFRGSQARKEVKTMKGSSEKINEKDESTQEVEEVIDIDLDDPETEMAATKIQAGYKGMKTRKEMKARKNENEEIVEENVTAQEAEEEIDIDMDDPETALAATKIQASFRGSQARKEVKTMKGSSEQINEKDERTQEVEEIIDIDLDDPETEMAATKIQAGYKGMKTRKEMKARKNENEGMVEESVSAKEAEEEIDIDMDDPETELAATKIQAGYKGMKTRKEMKAKKKENEETVEQNVTAQEAEEEIDIDLDDPETEMAATKIQAGYKGMKTRKEMKARKKENELEGGEGVIDIDLDDPETGKAATKIQAGFRGSKARKQVKEMKEMNEIVEEMEEEIDIDMDDPETAKAATKIQASFRGSQSRKEVKSMKEKEEAVQQDVTEPEAEEEIDIDMDDPETAKAATKIQASFRGSQSRKEVKQMKAGDGTKIKFDPDNPEVDEAATKIQSGYKNMKAREAKKKEEMAEDTVKGQGDEEIDIDLNDPEVEMAATKIQSGYKGMKTRKEMKAKKKENEEIVEQKVTAQEAEEEIDIDMDDPETAIAATKIQASFRGSQSRKEVKSMKEKEEAVKKDVTEPEAEEEIDIDMDDPETAIAATKIQASFRGSQSRKEVKSMKEKEETAKQTVPDQETASFDPNDPEVNEAATTIQAGYRGMKTRQTRQVPLDTAENKEIDINLNDPEVEMAATKIQSGYKGMKTRKEMKERKKENEEIVEQNVTDQEAEEEIDIDMDDPETAKAATKIQASFRGSQSRKEVKSMKEKEEIFEQSLTAQEAEEEIDIDMDDPETAKAATKIQASFRGSQSRKEVKTLKENEETVEQNVTAQEAEEEIDIDMDDPETALAATKIQASFRGSQARKEVKTMKETDEKNDSTQGDMESGDKPEAEEEMTTEMLIHGGAEEAQDQDARPASHQTTGDDGYTSPDMTLTLTSSVPGSPQQKSQKYLKLTGMAAPIHDPNSSILESMMSQDMSQDITDSELLEMNIDFPVMEEIEPTPLLPLSEEGDQNEDNADSKLSSLMTVANVDEIQTIEEEEGSGDHEVNVDDEKQESTKDAVSEGEAPPLDKPEEVAPVGAVPFEDPQGHQDEALVSQQVEDKCSEDYVKEKEQKEQIMLYYSKGSYTSEKVLVYLYERGIDFTSFNVDLSKGEQFSKWFLKINPKAEVPVLTIKDPSRDPRDPRHLKILMDSTRIMHSVDAKFAGDLPTPNLVPASTDTVAYQHHVYFTAIFDQVLNNLLISGNVLPFNCTHLDLIVFGHFMSLPFLKRFSPEFNSYRFTSF